MRRLTHSDVIAGALRLLTVPASARPRIARHLLQDADRASVARQTAARPHLVWGDGTLSQAARARRLPREPRLDTPDYAAAQSIMWAAIAEHGSQADP